MTMYLGIDLHKKTSAWVMVDEKRNIVWKHSAACHPLDISTSIKELPAPARSIKVAIEPVCGWRWVTKQLEEAGLEVHIAHPQKVRLIAESKQKTDWNDAKTLADLLRADMLPESYRISDEVYQLRVILRERNFLVSQRTGAKNRLHGLVTTQGMHLIPGGNPLHKKGKKWIEEEGNETMRELIEYIAELDAHVNQLTEKIERTAKEWPTAKLLMTMPGIGVITALTVISEVGEFSRFKNASGLTAFAGLVPRQRSSGDIVRMGSITHLGSRHLRTIMVEAAMRIRSDYAPELQSFVDSHKATSGPMRSRVALARKMLAIMWTMVKNNEAYDPEILVKARLSSSSSAIRKDSYLVSFPDA